MTDHTHAPAVRSFAADRKYREDTVDRWLQLAPTDAHALLDLARELRPSENQLRDLWTWTEEIARRDAVSLAHVLSLDAITAVRRRQVGRTDKIKLVKAALRRVRFPQLTATEDRLAQLVRELQLPRTVQVILPDCLEGDSVRVEIVIDSHAAWRAAAASLQAAAENPACQRLFQVLAEAE